MNTPSAPSQTQLRDRLCAVVRAPQRRTLRAAWVGALVAGVLPLAAWASAPAEKVVCTQAPRSAWMTEAKARALFGTETFTLVKFKISRGNCYEFYAIAQDGSVVEAYYDPVSGERVRYNRVSIARTEQTQTRYESQKAR